MRNSIVLGLVSFLTIQTGCAVVLGAPPVRADLGSVVTANNGTVDHGLRASVGTHVASGTTSRDVPFDLGVGIVYERSGATAGGVYDRAGVGSESLGLVSEQLPDQPNEITNVSYGGYLESSLRLHARGSSRSWIGSRFEVIKGQDSGPTHLSLTGRLSWEIYDGGTGAGADSSGTSFVMFAGAGTFGVGGYIESGVRHTMSGDNEFLMTGGLTLRIPAFVLLAIGCK